MKSNTMDDIIRVLTQPEPADIITLPENIYEKAQRCIDRMFELTQ